jgi:hypothetical protein
MRAICTFLVLAGTCLGQTADLAFKAGEKGAFTFDTGMLKGRLQVDGRTEGILSLVDVKSGVELTKGRTDFGLFNHYRLLSTDKRYGDIAWQMPKAATLLSSGGVQVDWPAADDRPLEMTAIFRWVAADTLDLETAVKPRQDLPKFEVFLSSYWNPNTRSLVYLSPARYGGKEPEFVSADACPLTIGTYLSFPRDLKSAQMVLDGRWEQGKNPVQWAISRYLAAPLVIRQDTVSGLAGIIMSRPQDCFAVNVSYNPPPADGVAGHSSTYLSLFGNDLKAGQTAKALVRLVVKKDIKPADALAAYKRFIEENK